MTLAWWRQSLHDSLNDMIKHRDHEQQGPTTDRELWQKEAVASLYLPHVGTQILVVPFSHMRLAALIDAMLPQTPQHNSGPDAQQHCRQQ